jgi:hypothetical protein
MLNALLARRFWIARILRWIVGAGVMFYLVNSWGWRLWSATLAGIVALFFTPLLWGIFLGILERRQLRRNGWPL